MRVQQVCNRIIISGIVAWAMIYGLLLYAAENIFVNGRKKHLTGQQKGGIMYLSREGGELTIPYKVQWLSYRLHGEKE